MKLNQFETDSALWRKIEEEIKKRLEVCRARNDGDLDEHTTARLRGSIAVYKEILGWSEQAPSLMNLD